MTKEEIKDIPEIVDFMLDKCVIADSRAKVRKRLEEVCDIAIKALEQEPCEDAVSRQAVLEVIRKYHCEEWVKADIGAPIEALPPVKPQPKADTLDKIRAEIDQKQYDFMSDGDYDEGIRFGLMLAYQIVDKYKAEEKGKK